uniref:Uncharacterized protein n=1 Tax=Timema poppense TaxID=170557 RepID=A0A7R9D3N1_TIMPO|nr:unnamed protein product [Timema poppensis]
MTIAMCLYCLDFRELPVSQCTLGCKVFLVPNVIELTPLLICCYLYSDVITEKQSAVDSQPYSSTKKSVYSPDLMKLSVTYHQVPHLGMWSNMELILYMEPDRFVEPLGLVKASSVPRRDPTELPEGCKTDVATA